jgi:hypothetical protein
MNENHEEERRRTNREREGPKIVSIREPEPEERAPPGPPRRDYPPERTSRPRMPPRIVEGPQEESRKSKILLIFLVSILICSNVALVWLYHQQSKEIEEIVTRVLDQALYEIRVDFGSEEFKAGKPLPLFIDGLNPSLFSKFGLDHREVKAEIVILRDGEKVNVNLIQVGTSQMNIPESEKMSAGLYDVKLRVTYKGVTREKSCGKITIQEAG